MGNVTTIMDPRFAPRPFALNIFFTTVIIIIALIAFFGNLATIIAIATTEELKLYIPNLFTFFLALTDFLTSFTVMLPASIAIAYDYWPFGMFGCRFHQWFNYFCIANTTQLLALISIDRALSITWPFHYPIHVTRNRVLIAVVIINCSSVMSTFSPIIWGEDDVYEYWEASCGVHWAAGTLFIRIFALWNYHAYGVFPQLSIVISVVIILRAVRKSQRNIQTVKQGERSNEDKQESKLLKSFLVLIVAFEVTVGFWATLRFSKVIKPSLYINPPWINTLTTPLLYAGSAVNPFIYAILRQDFRNAFKRIFTRLRNQVYPQ